MFKTELHCHSADASVCGRLYSDRIVEKYVEAGYTTLFLTNHFNNTTFNHKKFNLSDASWEEKIAFFMNGYHALVKVAEGKLNVLLGIEMRFDPDGINDYLIYGITEEFLLSHPEILNKSMEENCEIFREAGMLIIQAHPFRNKMKIIKPQCLDGIEVYNGHIGHDSRNCIAYQWAEMYNLIKTAGTDLHREIHQPCGGILTEEPITSAEQLIEVLRSGKYELLRDGSVPQ